MINTKLKKVNVMNDAVAKAFLRSKEARMIVASFLSEVTGIDKSVLMNATYTGGEIPKRRNYEKNKESDIMILIDELVEEFEGDEEYMEAVGKLEELVMDPDFAGSYDKGAKTEWLLEDMRLTGMHEGEAIGISKGRIEGKTEERLEIAKNMLQDTDDYGLISKYTGLSIEEIESLVEKNKVYSRKK